MNRSNGGPPSLGLSACMAFVTLTSIGRMAEVGRSGGLRRWVVQSDLLVPRGLGLEMQGPVNTSWVAMSKRCQRG